MEDTADKGPGKIMLIAKLGKKVADELLNPRQLLDTERRRLLIERGTRALRSLMEQKREGQALKQEIENSLVENIQPDGLRKYHARSPISVFVFPEKTQITYWNSLFENQTPDPNPKLIVTPTTWVRKGHGIVPEEGFSTGKNGVIREFATRSESDKIQHGAILFNTELKSIRLLPYKDFEKIKTSGINSNEMLMEANWFLDSENQDQILARPNLQRPESFSGIGRFFSDQGQQSFFSFSSQAESMVFSGGDRVLTAVSPTLQEVAAFCNVLSHKLGYQKWEIGGLEYNGGLTAPPDSPLDHGNDNQSKYHRIQVTYN